MSKDGAVAEVLKEHSVVNANDLEIMSWCRARCTNLQHAKLAAITKLALQSSTYIRTISAACPAEETQSPAEKTSQNQYAIAGTYYAYT